MVEKTVAVLGCLVATIFVVNMAWTLHLERVALERSVQSRMDALAGINRENIRYYSAHPEEAAKLSCEDLRRLGIGGCGTVTINVGNGGFPPHGGSGSGFELTEPARPSPNQR